MENSNLQNLKELLTHYRPKTFGVVTVRELWNNKSISSTLQLDGMDVTGLRNLRDFVFYSFQESMGMNQIWWTRID